MERVLTRELKPSSKHTRNFIERNAFMKVFLKVVGVLGVSLVMSGMIQDSTKASGTESHPRWCPDSGSICSRGNSRVTPSCSVFSINDHD